MKTIAKKPINELSLIELKALVFLYLGYSDEEMTELNKNDLISILVENGVKV